MISEVNSPDSLIKIFEGLSTDEKPVEGVRNGSELHEMDTSKTYMWSSETSEWIEQ